MLPACSAPHPDENQFPGEADPLLWTAEFLGFGGDEEQGWTRNDVAEGVVYRRLDRLGDLIPLEQLQIEVLGVGERDLIPASELVVVPETGGAVIAAYTDDPTQPNLIGALFGWGGVVAGVPRIVSDFLAVRPAFRGRGVGERLKKIQALVAVTAGFSEIVWTVDPLRAGNARLNVAKLGATCNHYQRNRYGTGFGAGLYGAMPSDRLHMYWHLRSRRVHHRLGGGARRPLDLDRIPLFAPGLVAPLAMVPIPPDIDTLLREDEQAAVRWRFLIRSLLEPAFAEGWSVQEFTADTGRAAYILSLSTPY